MEPNKNNTIYEHSSDTKRNISPRAVWKGANKTAICIVLLFFAFLLVVTSWLAIDKFILKSKAPSFAGYSILTVATGSMENTIMEGDLILIKNTGDYKIGDIITFAHKDETIPTTHRIINWAEDGSGDYVTRGDANNTEDRKNVLKEDVFGEVVLVMHGLGLFVGWLTEGGGYIYLLAIVLILVLGTYLIKDENNRLLQLQAQDNAQSDDSADKLEKTENDTPTADAGDQPTNEQVEDK